jgi:hypothetical protein
MTNVQHLRDRAARCFQLADDLRADAETLKRFGDDLVELARRSERKRASAQGTGRNDPCRIALAATAPQPS